MRIFFDSNDCRCSLFSLSSNSLKFFSSLLHTSVSLLFVCLKLIKPVNTSELRDTSRGNLKLMRFEKSEWESGAKSKVFEWIRNRYKLSKK